jgi:DNA adenine methylase
LESLAFATIIKNRVNRGGILANGASFIKNGENGKGITSRWYPETLRRRILAIAQVNQCLT